MVPDPESGEGLTAGISLYLEPGYVKQWLQEGISTVIVQRDDVTLEIDLKEITPDWFTVEADPDNIPPEDRIDFYVFTLLPVEEGILVEADILIDEEKIPADAFTGLVLKQEVINPDTGNHEIRKLEITENGVYRFE